MKHFIMLVGLTLSAQLFAHEGGHGPQITDSGKFGGVLTSVIEEGEAVKHGQAKMLYKAELVRSETNEVTVYIYDEKMNLIPMDKFSKDGKGSVEIQKNKKYVTTDFKLAAKGNHFEGIAPKPEKRPFNIDVHFSEGNRKLFAGFNNLD